MIFKDITDINFHGVNVPLHHEFNHEKVYYYEDELAGLKSLIAIHSSIKGPAIGGCRFRQYDTFDAGLSDVLRLSRGMTDKNNVAQIPFGGGKAVIFKDGIKSDALLTAFDIKENDIKFSTLNDHTYLKSNDGINKINILFKKKKKKND